MHLDCVKSRLSHRLCQTRSSEREAQEIFAKSKESWSAVELMNRHEPCYDVRTIFRGCSDCTSQSDHVYEPHFALDLVLPTCCRQIYHDAHSLIYSANTWSFTVPLQHRALCVPDTFSALVRVETFLHRLHIMVYDRIDEIGWDDSFRYIAGAFRSLRYFHIDIEQRPVDIHTLKKWHFQIPADCTFLKDLPVLRDLKLRAVTVTVADGHILHSAEEKPWAEDEMQYRWLMAKK